MMIIYRKTIHDALCGNVEFIKEQTGIDKSGNPVFKLTPDRINFRPKIIDDDKKHIQEICSRFYPIDKDQEPVMFVQIYSL
jgi:hypothetical protein